MEWLKAEIEFASAFSYRMPDTSSQFAMPCLLPGPSTVKLGLVATAILSSRKISEGERIFELIKQAEVCFITPERIAVFNPLIKRLKAKKQRYGFESTYGIRGYVIYSNILTLYLGFPQLSGEKIRDVWEVLKKLRRLGTSDSLLSILNVNIEAPKDFTLLVKPLDSFMKAPNGGLIQKIKDISPIATFEQINIYSNKVDKKVLIDKYYVIPVKTIKEGGNWILYNRR